MNSYNNYLRNFPINNPRGISEKSCYEIYDEDLKGLTFPNILPIEFSNRVLNNEVIHKVMAEHIINDKNEKKKNIEITEENSE